MHPALDYEVDVKVNPCINPPRSKRPKMENFVSKSYCETLLREKSERIKLVQYKGRSKVWETFRRVFIDEMETKFVHCCLCATVLIYESVSGTGSLLRHSCTRQSKASSTPAAAYFINEPFASAKFTVAEAAALCAAKDLRSVMFIEGDGFAHFAQTLIQIGAQYGNVKASNVLPSQITLSNTIEMFSTIIKEKIRYELENTHSVGISCDDWDHPDGNFFNVTIHFIKDSKLLSRSLGAIRVPEMGDSTELNQLLIDFNIDRKNHILVSSLASDLRKELAVKSTTKDNHIWEICALRSLECVLMHTFSQISCDHRDVQRVITSCKTLVTFLKRNLLHPDLRTNTRQLIEIEKGSTYEILDFVRNNFDSLEELSKSHLDIGSLLYEIDRSVLEKILSVTDQLRCAKEVLCNTKECTFYQVLLTKAKLLMYCKEDDDDALVSSIKSCLLENIQHRFVISLYHICATLLVPKFRRLNNMCENAERENAIRFLINLTKEANDVYNCQQDNMDISSERIPDDMFDSFTDPILPETRDNQVEAEVKDYLNFTFNLNDYSLSPIDFWHKKRSQYPSLHKLALWLHAIPAVSHLDEQNYHFSGLNVIDKRTRLDPERVSSLLFIRANLNSIIV